MWERFFQILWHSQNILTFKGEGRKLGHYISLRASKKGWAERLGIMIDIQIG